MTYSFAYRNLLFWLLLCVASPAVSQVLNWKALDSTRHIVHTSLGMDNGTVWHVGYSYKLQLGQPLVLGAQAAKPSGAVWLDDFTAQVGGQYVLFSRTHWVGSAAAYGLYRRYGSRAVRLQNFGSEMSLVFGYYRKHWHVAAEAGFDKAIVTHFKHSDLFKREVYGGVADGWYEPATGGLFNAGL